MQKYKNKKILFGSALLLTLVLIPQVSFATTFTQLVVFFVDKIINPAIAVIIGLAAVYFFWGVAKYILHSDDTKMREEGRNMMIYGIIAIFVMVSIWGFVNLLNNTFKLNRSTLPRAEDILR